MMDCPDPERLREMDLQTIGPSGELLDAINVIQSDLQHNKLVPALRDPALGESSVSFNALKRLPYSVSNTNEELWQLSSACSILSR